MNIIKIIVAGTALTLPLYAEDGRYDAFTLLKDSAGNPTVVASLYVSGYAPALAFENVGNQLPEAVVVKKIELLQKGDLAGMSALYVTEANAERRQKNIEQLSDPTVVKQIATANKKIISKVWFGDLVAVYYVIGEGEGQPLYLCDYVAKEGDQWRINPNIGTLSSPILLVSLQGRQKDEIPAGLLQGMSWVDFGVDSTGEATFGVSVAHPAKYGFLLDSNLPSVSLEPYGGKDAGLSALASMIADYRTQKDIATLNAKWRLPEGSDYPADKLIDYVGWYNDPQKAFGPMQFTSRVSTEFGKLVTMKNSMMAISVFCSSGASAFPIQYGVFDPQCQEVNMLIVQDGSLTKALSLIK